MTIDFYSETLFPTQGFATLDILGELHYVCVLKARCQLQLCSTWTSEGVELQLSDAYYGDPHSTSMQTAADIVPFKPRTDIYFRDPSAISPDGIPAKAWDVAIEVGKLRHDVRVTGSRYWQKCWHGWQLSETEAAMEVPLRYELAFGGATDNRVCQYNPIGVGFDEMLASAEGQIVAPQILLPGQRLSKPGMEVGVAALGPVPGAWLPRRALAGTMDADWRLTRWPYLPEDFDFGFYNCAPRPLQYSGYLRGDENIILEGMSVERIIAAKLPGGLQPCVLMQAGKSRGYWSQMRLDTLCIDVTNRFCDATFRTCFAAEQNMREAVIFPNVPKEIIHAT